MVIRFTEQLSNPYHTYKNGTSLKTKSCSTVYKAILSIEASAKSQDEESGEMCFKKKKEKKMSIAYSQYRNSSKEGIV